MGGFFRFLLGGVLGAAVGIAVSRKLAPAPRKKTVPGVQFGERPVAPLTSPVGVPTVPTPTAVPTRTATPTPTVEMPIAVTPAALPPTTSPSAAAPASVVPPAAAPPAMAPPVEEPGPRFHEQMAPPVFVPPVPQPVPPEEEISQFAAETATFEEAPGFEDVAVELSEIMVTPEVLEEPVPGTGWSSSEVLEEEAIESVLPIIPEEVLPEVSAEVGESVTLPEVEAAVESPAPASPAPASPPPPVVEIPTAEDLRARIEATRRRIREELERPFIADVEIEDLASVPAPAPSFGPVSPASAPAVPAEEAVVGPVEVAAPPRLPEPAVAPLTPGEEPEQEGAALRPSAGASVPVSDETVIEPSEAPPAEDSLVSPDYETIRARIELTRSRLKAKAFDALMAGESALLGRDPAGVRPQPVKVEGVDGDIEQTIETTLREQED